MTEAISIRLCHECKRDISHKRSNAWFCGDACRQRSHRRERSGVGYMNLTPAMARAFKKGISNYPGHMSPPDSISRERWSDIRLGRARRFTEFEFKFVLGHYPKAVYAMFGLAEYA